MLYAVINAQGEPIAEGLTEAEAAHAILTYDGGGYEIRSDPDGEGWILWGKSLNGPWIAYIFGSWETDRDDAEAEIMAEVVGMSDTAARWPAEAIPQDDWDAMQAQLAEEGAE
jgi:hypothetical protein